jgi:excisionase family DNA binding protein
MEQLIILQGISVEELLTRIDAVVEKKISEKISQLKTIEPIRFMTSKEVAKYLQISLPTVNFWSKKGWLKSYRIGSRIRFKSNEVEESLKFRRFIR